jgi:hypothetical protein
VLYVESGARHHSLTCCSQCVHLSVWHACFWVEALPHNLAAAARQRRTMQQISMLTSALSVGDAADRHSNNKSKRRLDACPAKAVRQQNARPNHTQGVYTRPACVSGSRDSTSLLFCLLGHSAAAFSASPAPLSHDPSLFLNMLG